MMAFVGMGLLGSGFVRALRRRGAARRVRERAHFNAPFARARAGQVG